MASLRPLTVTMTVAVLVTTAVIILSLSTVSVEATARASSDHYHRHLTTKHPLTNPLIKHTTMTATEPRPRLIHRRHQVTNEPNSAQLYIYPSNSSCDAPPIVSLTLQSGVCQNFPFPIGPYREQSVELILNNQTNQYDLQLYYDLDCPQNAYGGNVMGQGNECNLGNGDLNPFHLISPILAPCTYTVYGDAECETEIITQFGMTPNTCVANTILGGADNDYIPISININQQSNSFDITGYPYNERGSCTGVETLFVYTGQLNQCVANATLSCNF